MNFNNPILIFDYQLSGHHLEYIHHLYMAAIKRKNVNFVFSLPNNFQEISNVLDWPSSPNVAFSFFNNEKLSNSKRLLLRSWHFSKILRCEVIKHDTNQIFLITSILGTLPFLPFFLSKASVSGIIYKIYLYKWKKSSLLNRIQDVIKYQLLSKCSLFKSIYILNDEVSAIYLNRIYKTERFRHLVDPFKPLSESSLKKMKSDLGISCSKYLLLHFGSMSDAKGTLEILQSISFIEKEKQEKYAFVFAGVIASNIKSEFYRLVEQYRKDIQIIVIEGFLEYDTIGSLCMSCDVILTPYKRINTSSGAIGYAAQFKKPVIATGGGLLGKLVNKYHLGVLISDVSGESIADGIRRFESWHYRNNSYLEKNNITNFQNKIIEDLIEKY